MNTVRLFFIKDRIGSISLWDILYMIARFCLSVIFIIAAINKIPHLDLFRENVTAYHILPLSFVPAFSFLLSWIELLVGIYLFLGLFEKATSAVTIGLLCMFIIALSYAILTKQPVSGCGCFSQTGGPAIGWDDVIRDCVFIVLACIVFFHHIRPYSLDWYLFPRLHVTGDNNDTTSEGKTHP